MRKIAYTLSTCDTSKKILKLAGIQEPDFDVERRTPAPQVVEIVVDAGSHLRQFGRFPTAAVNLHQSCEARQYLALTPQ